MVKKIDSSGEKPTIQDLQFRVHQLEKETVERRKAEDALEKNRKKYQELVQNANSIIMRLDTAGNILFFNEYAQSFLGFSADQIIGRNLLGTIVPETDSAGRDLTNIIQWLTSHPERYITHENENIKRNGERIWVAWTNKAIRDEQGNVEEILCIGNDITDRKNVEKELRRSHEELEMRVQERTKELLQSNEELKQEINARKKMESQLTVAKMKAESASQVKSEFLSNISHELRTPLHHVLAYAKFGLDMVRNSDGKMHDYFNNIRSAGMRLKEMLDDLLDLTYLEDKKIDFEMKSNDLKSIVATAVSELEKKTERKKVDIIVHHTDLNTVIECDRNLILQVVRKLISNAVKFTSSGKALTIYFKQHPLEQLKAANALSPESGISINLEDSGVGIPEDELESIFDAFNQSSKTKTGAGGKGLGLTICKLIVQAHQGEIWVKNNPDGGATFSFALPYQQQ